MNDKHEWINTDFNHLCLANQYDRQMSKAKYTGERLLHPKTND